MRDCRKKKKETEDRGNKHKEKQKSSDTGNEAAFSAEIMEKEVLNSTTEDMWIFDSGASKQMTFRSDWMSDLRKHEDECVSLGDGTTCKVSGRGTVHIKRLVNGQWLDGKLEDVLYVPDLKKNLFSVGACMKKDYKVIFKDDTVELFLDGMLKAYGMRRNNNLFYMFFKGRSRNNANVVTTSNVKRWHERLGHVNYKYIRQMHKDGLINDSVPANVKETDFILRGMPIQ